MEAGVGVEAGEDVEAGEGMERGMIEEVSSVVQGCWTSVWPRWGL